MKKVKVVALSLVLAAAMMLSSCGANPDSSSSSSSSTNWPPEATDVESGEFVGMTAVLNDTDKNATIVLTSTDSQDVFKSTITDDDVVLYATNDETGECVLLSDFSVTYLNTTSCRINAGSLPDVVDGFSVAVKASATLVGKVIFAATKGEIEHTKTLSDISAEDVEKIKQALNDKSIFDTLSGLAGSAVSAYNGVTALLKMLGIMEDPTMSAVIDVKRCIENLSGQVTALSNDMRAMYNSLDAKLSKIGSDVQKLLYIENEKTWEDFRTDYIIKNGIQKQIENFQNIYTREYLAYAQTTSGEFVLYYDTNGDLTYPENMVHDADTDWVSVDGTIIDESKTISFTVTEKTFEKTRGLTHKSLDDETFTKTLQADLKAALLTVDGVDESNVDKYLTDALSEFDNYSTRKAMNTPTDGGILANDIISNFNEYCAALTRSSNNPIAAYRYMITSGYNFQSEAEEDLQSFDDYIMVQTGTYKDYVDIAAKVGNVTNAVKESANTAKTNLMNYLAKNTGRFAEKKGDQYCYVTNNYVKANQYTATIYESATGETSFRFFYISCAYKTNSFTCAWSNSKGESVISPTNTIGTDEVKAIYAIYQTMKELGKVEGTFEEYYQEKLTDIQTKDMRDSYLPAAALISGSTYNFTDFALDGSHNLTAYSWFCRDNYWAGGENPYYFKQNTSYNIGTESANGKASNGYYVQHKSIKADVMDITAETFADNSDILYGAIYAEDHGSWQLPEVWMFGGAPTFKGTQAWWSHTYTMPPVVQTYDVVFTYYVSVSGTYWAICSD